MELLGHDSIKHFYIENISRGTSVDFSTNLSERQSKFIRGMSDELPSIYEPLQRLKSLINTTIFFRETFKNSSFQINIKPPSTYASK